MPLSSPAFLSPASLSFDQVQQLLQLSIRAKQDCQEGEGTREKLEQKIGELAAKFFNAVSGRPQRKPCCG